MLHESASALVLLYQFLSNRFLSKWDTAHFSHSWPAASDSPCLTCKRVKGSRDGETCPRLLSTVLSVQLKLWQLNCLYPPGFTTGNLCHVNNTILHWERQAGQRAQTNKSQPEKLTIPANAEQTPEEVRDLRLPPQSTRALSHLLLPRGSKPL